MKLCLKKYQLTLRSCKSSIDHIPEYVTQLQADFALDERMKADILLTLTEAVSNAIIHGNCEDDTKAVHVTLVQPQASVLSFQVSDQGDGFDPESVPNPTHPDHIAEPGGRGVFLIKQFCDCVRYIDKGSTVEIEFNLDCKR